MNTNVAQTAQDKYAVWDLAADGPPKNIFEAAERGNLAYITRVLERTVELDINMRDNLSRTALHWAAELGHQDCAKLLLENGADPAATECNGRTAVHLASRSADAAMLKVLLDSVTDEKAKERLVNQTDMFGVTPVFLALQKSEEGHKVLELLIGCGAHLQDPVASRAR